MADTAASKASRVSARRIRWTVLVGVLVLSTTFGLVHQYAPALRTAGTDALCPLGGVETLWTLFAEGGYIKRVAASSLVLLGIALLLAAGFGRVFCGRFCALGTLQEMFGVIGKRLGLARRVVVPPSLDRFARLGKYVVLVVLTGLTWRASELIVRPYDPWAAYHHLTSPDLLIEFGAGLGVLAVSLVGSLFIDRAFCRYACPMGALLGIVSKFSWMKLRRAEDACTACGACDKACPVGLPVATADVVSPSECLACGECTSACPTGALRTEHVPGGLGVTSPALTAVTVGVMAAAVGAATVSGDFAWVQPSLATQIEASATTSFDVNAIRGYMSMAEVAEASGLPLGEMAAVLGLPEDLTSQPLKEVTEANGFSVEDLRAYVEQRLGAEAYRGAEPAGNQGAGEEGEDH